MTETEAPQDANEDHTRPTVGLNASSSAIDLRVVGTMTATRGNDTAARIGGPKQRAVLAVLAAELESPVIRYPYRESFRAQLVLALYRAGRHRDTVYACGQVAEGTRPGGPGTRRRQLRVLETQVVTQDSGRSVMERSMRRPTSKGLIDAAVTDLAGVNMMVAVVSDSRTRGDEA